MILSFYPQSYQFNGCKVKKCLYVFISWKYAYCLPKCIFLHILYKYSYIAYCLPSAFVTAKIDGDDRGYGSDARTQHDPRSGQAKQLRADRWHRTPAEEVIDGDDVSGIRSQMWMWAMKRTLMTRRLSRGGTYNVGYDALRWENILHGDCGEYGLYHELSVLPDKIARFLFEFNSDSFASLHLPEIPEDRSLVNIHALMDPPQSSHRILFMHILLLYAYMALINIFCRFWLK